VLVIAPSLDAQNKKQLLKENASLKQKIDSLISVIESSAAQCDSLDTILHSLEEAEGGKTVALVNPEDYTPEITDSLLSLWYVHELSKNEDTDLFNLDSIRFSSNVPDSVYIERIKAMNSYINLPYNDIVRNYIILYSEKKAGSMPRILGLCRYYMPIIQEAFDRYNLPEELKALAVIESALNPCAVSRVGAKGMWQFMYNIGKSYGLQIDSFVDERMDVFKSADAAARYLRDHYKIFGDWNLAIASYNCGAGNVRKAIVRSGGKSSFWDIYPYLPRETRGYVPAFVGALYTLTYFREHGLTPVAIEFPAHVDTLEIHRHMHFEQISNVIGLPVADLRNLNPQYRHDIIPATEKEEYTLRIPYTFTRAFIEKQDSICRYKADSLFNPSVIKKVSESGDGERITYTVRSGDSLGKIAGKYHVSVTQLKNWNHISGTNIRVGQKLVIYRKGGPSVSQAPSKSSSSTKKFTGYTSYTVKEGDSFYLIASRFPGITDKDIMSYNGITSTMLKPGTILKIPTK